MAWNTSGDDRVKRFRVYQELEAQYQQALAELNRAKDVIQEQSNTIRTLARELGGMADSVAPPPVPAAAEQKATKSGTHARVDPEAARNAVEAKANVPFSKLFGAGTGR